MITIADKHLVLQPKLNSDCRLFRLPLLAAYICPVCDDVIYAAVKLEPGQTPPRINLYHENLNGNLVNFNILHLTPANRDTGAVYIESGHRKQGRLDEVGRYTSGRCSVVKMIIEPDPLRRALQFLRYMSQIFVLPSYASGGGKTSVSFNDVIAALEEHPDLVYLVENFVRLRPRVVALDEIGQGPPAWVLRHSGWDNCCFVDPCREILNRAAEQNLATCKV